MAFYLPQETSLDWRQVQTMKLSEPIRKQLFGHMYPPDIGKHCSSLDLGANIFFSEDIFVLTNSVDPVEMPRYAAFDMGFTVCKSFHLRVTPIKIYLMSYGPRHFEGTTTFCMLRTTSFCVTRTTNASAQSNRCLCCWDITYGHLSFLIARSVRFQLNRLENYHVTGDCRSLD